MTTFLVILGACFIVSGLVGLYAYAAVKWDARERNDERNLPSDGK